MTPPASQWPIEILLADVVGRLKRPEEMQDMLRELARKIPDEQIGARIRVAELLGDEVLVAELSAESETEETE